MFPINPISIYILLFVYLDNRKNPPLPSTIHFDMVLQQLAGAVSSDAGC